MFSASENFRKKTGILFLTLFVSSFLFPFSEAKADVPVLDASVLAILTTNQPAINFSTGSLWTKEYILDKIAWLVAKSLLKTLSTQIINWVKTGDSRGSLFIENFLDHFLSEMDNAVGLWLEQYFGKNSQLLKLLCEPFRLSLPPLLQAHRRSLSYTERARCKLTDIVRNVQNFNVQIYQNDFSHGGWDAWFAMLEPENNIFGQYLMGVDEIERQRAAALLASETEVNTTGGGLLSWQQCDDVVVPGFGDEPGETLKGNCRIQTPGGLVEDQLTNVFGSSIKQLEIADELNEILAAFFQVALDSLLSSIGGFSNTDFNSISDANQISIPPPPTSSSISITTPLDDSYVSGNIRISALVGNLGTTTQVQFTLDGANLGSPISSSGNAEINLDTITLAEGPHTITAILLDQNGNRISESSTVTINVDRTPPTVGIPSTSDGVNLSGNVNRIQVEAADNGDERAVTVQFLLDGRSIGTASFQNGRHRLNDWDSRNIANGTYQLTARATDRAGNTVTSSSVTITINN